MSQSNILQRLGKRRNSTSMKLRYLDAVKMLYLVLIKIFEIDGLRISVPSMFEISNFIPVCLEFQEFRLAWIPLSQKYLVAQHPSWSSLFAVLLFMLINKYLFENLKKLKYYLIHKLKQECFLRYCLQDVLYDHPNSLENVIELKSCFFNLSSLRI